MLFLIFYKLLRTVWVHYFSENYLLSLSFKEGKLYIIDWFWEVDKNLSIFILVSLIN